MMTETERAMWRARFEAATLARILAMVAAYAEQTTRC